MSAVGTSCLRGCAAGLLGMLAGDLACPNPGISGGMAPSRGGKARTYLLLALQRKHFRFVLFYFVLRFFPPHFVTVLF